MSTSIHKWLSAPAILNSTSHASRDPTTGYSGNLPLPCCHAYIVFGLTRIFILRLLETLPCFGYLAIQMPSSSLPFAFSNYSSLVPNQAFDLPCLPT